MATLDTHDAQLVERANDSGRTPVVFVHGLWLLPSSWERWAKLLEEAGHTALTIDWPDDPQTVEEAKAHPEVFAHKSVEEVADHYCTVPWAIANASYKKQRGNEGVTEIVKMPSRGHSLTIDNGWREVADTALRFVQRFLPGERQEVRPA